MNDHATETEEKSPLPRMVSVGDVFAPATPTSIEDAGVDGDGLADLALKAAYSVPQFTTEWIARTLRLSLPLAQQLVEQLKTDFLVEILGHAGPFNYRCSVSQRGRERAVRLLEISGYVGPAPVTLEAYTAMLKWQLDRFPRVNAGDVAAALSDLVLSDHALEVAGLALSSGRSLLLHGPTGNGKTSLGRLLHRALHGDLWVPHCIAADNCVIRVFDPRWHQPSSPTLEPGRLIDQRWVRIRRPFIAGGGEMTLASFELTYSPAQRYYEAPMHLKANGGIFLIDDFGRQRVDARELLNRWIVPLERRIDYLTLQSGQRIQAPFRPMLIFSTNLDPDSLMDPAFLRRMGYRLYMGAPTPEQYAAAFERCAARSDFAVPPGLVARLLDRSRAEERELQYSQPHEFIQRARDICQYLCRPVALSEEVLDLAWNSYFGAAGSFSDDFGVAHS
ncbi:MAG TPA: AAA family ATPase [Planctomycetales bacterium]|jgi:MoxR-like ATPase|nr:AAA family ATPase [Planctomycetales bacterium]